ncbi:antigen-presenting glycoprotein CD1d-like isoform X1 [Phalacrocorax aristotelis]|uniref:antigen-presenting glycoprotein CD1d-like isoform X1 n=1 Tax=Phalacrocorax aristotelis TaxID=126867 RepID=UPI003F4C6ECF
MQPPHHCFLCLLFLYLLFLSGTWADLEGTFTIRLLQTSIFQNTSFVDTEGLGLLEDIKLGSLDKHTWTIHFYQPWVHPALPRSDWDTIENMIKIYLQKFNHLINEGAMEKDVSYPFVAQCMGGCKLYPNRTSRAFAYVGYNGQDFLSFDVDNGTWFPSQDTYLSRYVQAVLQNYTAFSELVAVLFNDTCVDDMEMFLRYGKAALERQGETALILAQPPQSPTHTGAKQCPIRAPPPKEWLSCPPEAPVATVFARTPRPDQLLLVCRVTGFYPRPISVAWLRDGQEVPPGPALNTSTILPNADLTYQFRSILAVAPGDGHSYACRVSHRSLGTRSLLIPWGNSEMVLIAGLGAGLLAAVAMAAIMMLWVQRRRKHQQMEESESRNSILSKEA